MVHLAIRISRRTMTHLGRETFLTPVIWQEDWPRVENHKKAVLDGEGPLWSEQERGRSWEADFHISEWEPEWIFLREPQKGAYVRGSGELRLYPSQVHFPDRGNPVFAAVRQMDFEFEMEAAFTFEPCEIGDEAGIGIVLSSQFYYCFVKKRTEEGDFLVLEKNAEDMHQTACRIPVPEGELYLSVRGEKEYYYFNYSLDGESFYEAAKASTRFLACEVSGRCFTGTVTGLHAACCRETKAVMKVRRFRIRS